MALRKTAICKLFNTPEGCPYPECRFAHGSAELRDGGQITLSAQREMIREQVAERQKTLYKEKDVGKPNFTRETVIDRYYTQMYAVNVLEHERHDIYIQMHSNRLCVIGLAPSHPALDQDIESVQFDKKVLESKVGGKKKKGGLFLLPETVLCRIRCASGDEYDIPSCIRGALLEVNDRVMKEPSLIKHAMDGYLIITQPKTVEVFEIQQSLVSKREYDVLRSPTAVHDA